MDIELLFSSSPFVQKELGQFSYIKPNIEITLKDVVSTDNKQLLEVEIPKECKNTNVMIEVSAPFDIGVKQVKPYFSHSLAVNLYEDDGEIKVLSSTGGPIPCCYIKVYSVFDGEPVFYKDGYTDLRGVFDYSSLSVNALDRISKFSILVLSENHGSTILEANVSESIRNRRYENQTQKPKRYNQFRKNKKVFK